MEVLLRQGKASRTHLAAETGLRPASVTWAVQQLTRRGLVRETGRVEVPGRQSGRRRTCLELDPAGMHCLGVALEEGCLYLLALDLGGGIAARRRVTFPPETAPAEIIALARTEARALAAEAGLPPGRLAGLAFVDPGLVDVRGGVSLFSYFIPGWENVPVRALLEDRFAVPVTLTGTCQAKAWAEYRFGAGRGCDDFMFIEYGSGIACGIVSGGRIVHGCLERAGELGHYRFTDLPDACRCGATGCLEAVASLAALAERARRETPAGGPARPEAETGGGREAITGAMVLAAAAAGDRPCRRIAREALDRLAVATANAANLFNPRLIILDRNLAAAGTELLARFRRIVTRETVWGGENPPVFRISPLGPESGALGGGLRALEKAIGEIGA